MHENCDFREISTASSSKRTSDRFTPFGTSLKLAGPKSERSRISCVQMSQTLRRCKCTLDANLAVGVSERSKLHRAAALTRMCSQPGEEVEDEPDPSCYWWRLSSCSHVWAWMTFSTTPGHMLTANPWPALGQLCLPGLRSRRSACAAWTPK